MERKRILMCRPTFYDVVYQINVHMRPVENPPHKDLAKEQWESLLHTVTLVGLTVELLNPYPTTPDIVFTANAGLVLPGNRFVLPRFATPERQVEEPFIERWAFQRGYELVRLNPDLLFEGEGDAFVLGDRIVAGYGFRTHARALGELQTLSGMPVLQLELVDAYWYHLDTCFLPLRAQNGKWLVAFYPEAFSTVSVQTIRNNFETIEVLEQEAKKFACNSIVNGNNVIIPTGCPALSRDLRDYGFTVYEVPMSEFLKSGGACKCLALYLE